MAGLFPQPRSEARPSTPDTPTPLPEPVRRADAGPAAAEQTERFTRRAGRAWSFLSGGNATGGLSVSRFLGSVGRT